MPWNRSLKFANLSDKKILHGSTSHHISFSIWQPHNACAESSISLQQRSQRAFGLGIHLLKFCFVGRESLQALQMKCRILLGTVAIYSAKFFVSILIRRARCSSFRRVMEELISRFCWVNTIFCGSPNQFIFSAMMN